MPKYHNSLTVDVTLPNGKIVSAQDDIVDNEFFDSLPDGITKTADVPCKNNIAVSQTVIGNNGDSATITLPVGVKGVVGVVYCKTGTATVYENSTSNTPGLSLIAGFGRNIETSTRTLDSVIVNITKDGTELIVNLEQA